MTPGARLTPASDRPAPQLSIQRVGGWLYDHRRVMLMLVFASVCVAVAVAWEDGGRWVTAVKELGYAGLISVFLYFTVEQYARDRHQEVIAENMKNLKSLQNAIVTETLNTLYDRQLPPAAKEAIEKLLLHPTVIRERMKLEISFEWAQGREAVRIAMTASYTLSNIAGHGEQIHELSGSDDVASKIGVLPGREIRISDVPITVGHGRDYKVAVQDDTGNFVVTLDDRAKIQLRDSTAMSRQREGREVFRIGLLTYSLIISVKHPDDIVPKVVLSAVPNSDERLKTEPGRAEWSFETDVLLPGHTLMLAWAPAPRNDRFSRLD